MVEKVSATDRSKFNIDKVPYIAKEDWSVASLRIMGVRRSNYLGREIIHSKSLKFIGQ